MTDFMLTYPAYYDGPREGVATFNGRPHVYQSLWQDERGHPDLFLLQPIDDVTAQVAEEAWEIWKRWDAAFRAGQTTIETHPALPEDRARSEVLEEHLRQALSFATAGTFPAFCQFAGAEAQPLHSWRPIPVRWVRADWRPASTAETPGVQAAPRLDAGTWTPELAIEPLLQNLRERGYSIGDSMRVLLRITPLGPGEVKAIVQDSAAWRDLRADHEAFDQQLEDIARALAAEGRDQASGA